MRSGSLPAALSSYACDPQEAPKRPRRKIAVRFPLAFNHLLEWVPFFTKKYEYCSSQTHGEDVFKFITTINM